MSVSEASLFNPDVTVRTSPIHGRGVFALRRLPAEACLGEYTGRRITETQAAQQQPADPDNPCHTFYFSLEDGQMIDGAADGNASRWINHSCAPNCEAHEEEGRVFIYALRDIEPEEELLFDYRLALDARYTAALKRAYACHCAAPECRGTMLGPKPRAPRKKREQAAS